MHKFIKIFIIIILFMMNTPSFGQEGSDSKIKISKKTFGIQVGAAHFQNVSMNLLNFQQEILTSSENIVPVNLMATFFYYFTPSLAVRFSSGYGFSQHKSNHEIDYGKIDMMNLKVNDTSTFTATGFPTEVAVIFKTPFDARANLFFYLGAGLGYYVYNYQAEGALKKLTSKTNAKISAEEYINPEMTLSGSAQFFIMGLEININPRVSASLEVSKLGWSSMILTQDILKQEVEAGVITNERKYGYSRQDYPVKNGVEDITIALGLNWNL